MIYARSLLVVMALSSTASAWGQSFMVTVDYPPQSAGKQSLMKSLAAPLIQEGSGSAANLSQDLGIARAAAKLAAGFRDTTQVDFLEGNGGQAVRYASPNLSGGPPSQQVVFRSPTVYMRRHGDTMTIEDRPLAYDLYDNSVVRFVMLGAPLPDAPTASPRHGKVRFRSSPTMIRVVEWMADQKGQLTVTSAIESDHRLVPTLRAHVAADRSAGWIERIGNPGTAPVRSTFTRLKKTPNVFNFPDSFPPGLAVLDYRGGRVDPPRYVWQGSLKHTGQAAPQGLNRVRIGSGSAGLALLGFGLLSRRKARLVRKIG